MKISLLKFMFAISFVGLLSACGSSSSTMDSTTTPDPVIEQEVIVEEEPVVATGAVTGKILDFKTGGAVVGATVSTGSITTTTDINGRYTLSNVPYADRVVINVLSTQYASQTKAVQVSDAENNVSLTISMLPVGTVLNFDATSAQTLDDSASVASVLLNANSLVDGSGVLPTENVTIKITEIDPSVDPEVMPGDFSVMTGTTSGYMESFGAVNVTFEDASGNSLNLADGATAVVRIPLADNVTNPASTMPLFYFDEVTGRWVEEGTAMLMGTAPDQYYEGSVSHFSTWNADSLYTSIMINGCVVDLAGDPVTGITVKTEGRDYNGTSTSTTDELGYFSIEAKPNARVLVYATDQGTKTNTGTVLTGSSDYDMALGGTGCLILGDISTSIKLTWGQDPRDLDSHLIGPNNSFQIAYFNRGSLDSTPYAQLDVDDTSSFGPEVITITRFETPGTYTYSVYHFSGSSTIDVSPARVELNLNGDVTVFTPPGGSDVTWNVFELVVDANSNVTVNPLNTWSSMAPSLF